MKLKSEFQIHNSKMSKLRSIFFSYTNPANASLPPNGGREGQNGFSRHSAAITLNPLRHSRPHSPREACLLKMRSILYAGLIYPTQRCIGFLLKQYNEKFLLNKSHAFIRLVIMGSTVLFNLVCNIAALIFD